MVQMIAGSKGSGGGGSSDKGGNRGTEIASVAYMKLLLALSEGEIAGGFTGKDIYLDGTPLQDENGLANFPGVTWEWRSGTPDQDYIQGFPSVENETSLGYELKYGTPWVKSITNTQLSAVRLRLKFPNGLYYMRDSGGKNGYRVEYAIDISTDGSTYTEYGTDAADGIGNTGYERSYRIDLPPATSGWQIRVRRLTENSTDGRHADTTRIESMSEIVDAKLAYPHTALLFIQFDAKLFDGRTPTVTVKTKGILCRIPANYDPVNRTYAGTWDGTFRWAWTNNPAWVFYDLVLSKRYGLGRRISADQVDKWALYKIAQYCDAPVSDGAGGKEARFLCDLYLQSRSDAWTVLMDMASIFRGMLSWSNNLLTVDADMPRELDPDFVFNKSNIVGQFNFSGSSEKTNYSAAIVTYSNPANGYKDDQASVHVQAVSSRFGFNTLDMTAVGCTRESEGQRRGLWAIETNRDDNAVEFTTGMEGRLPRVGKIIGVNNAPLAGRANGGRVAAATATKITLDRNVAAKAGDRLIVNLPTGKSEGRDVKSVSGRVLTVTQPFSVVPDTESAWVLDQPDLGIQLFRVKRVARKDDNLVTISGLPYNPNKFARIDDGAIIEDRPVSIVPPRNQEMPSNIQIGSSYRVEQGIGITTMEVTWDGVKNAVAYEAQWRQNSGDWINASRTGNTRFEVDGIYAGRYTVRVRAINALDVASAWATSVETQLNGKVGKPPIPVNLKTESLVFGIRLSWSFPAGAQDTLKTEIHYSETSAGDSPLLLSDVPYPSSSYQQMGLLAGKRFWYRARLVDRIGNQGDWTEWVMGESSTDVSDITKAVLEQMMQTELVKDMIEDAVATNKTVADMADQIAQNADQLAEAVGANRQMAEGLIQHSLAIADIVFRQSVQNGANSAKFEQLREVVATETEARVTDVTRLEAKTDGNTAELVEVRQALTTETEARATAVDQLTAQTQENTASVTELTQAVTELDSSTASRFDELTAEIAGQDGQTGAIKGSLQNTGVALIQSTLAQVSLSQQLSVQYGDNKAGIARVDNVMADATKAVAESLKTLDANAGGGTANTTDFAKAMADFSQAAAQKINTMTVTLNGQTAAITETSKVLSDLSGNINAMYSVKIAADVNGVKYMAGIGLGLENTPAGMQSQMVVLADRFAVMAQAGGTVMLPLVVQGGQTFINQALIGKGWIQNAMIGDYIQSNSWDGTGNVGWHINKSGFATFNGVTVRGSIYATSGNFAFNGANNVVVIDGNGLTVNLPGGGMIRVGTW
jgi:predicted phage tail protein